MIHSPTKPGYFRLTILLKVFSCLLFLLSANVAAQTILSGTVTNPQGEKLSGVKVTNRTTGSAFTTGNDGTFTVNAVQGENQLVFHKDGYTLHEQAIKPAENSTVILQQVTELNEVIIQKEKEKLFALGHLKDIEETAIYAGKKTEVIAVDKLTANKAANNARQIFAQVVGLTINENSDGGLQLSIGGRGLNPNRTSNFNTRQNGYDISADVLGYPESYYTTPAEALEEIQIIRGAASLQYGTQFGGLINFKLHTPSTKPIEVITRTTAGSYGLFTNFTSLSGTNKKFSYYTYFNYKQGDGFRPNSAFSSRNFFINLNYQFTDKTSLHFDYTLFDYLAKQPGGLTDAMFNSDIFQSNRPRNWFDVNWNLFALRLKHKFTESADFSLQLFGLDASRNTVGYLSNRANNPDTGEGGRDLIVGKFVNWGAEARYLQKYTLKNQTSALLLGAKYYQARNKAMQGAGSAGLGADFNPANDAFPLYPSQSDYTYPNLNVSFFGENMFKLSQRFTVTPGFRFESIRTQAEGYWRRINRDNAGNVILDQLENEDVVKSRNFILLGLGLSYKLNNGIAVYGNISQNYRSVTFNDIRTASPGLIIDPNITDEKGYTFDAGLRGRIDERFSYDTSIYALMYRDKIGETQSESELARYRTNIGTAITYGWEVMADWNIAKTWFKQNESLKWNIFVNNAITKSEYLKSGQPNVKGNEVEFVPLYNLKTGTTAGYKNFLVSVQFTYLSSQFTDSNNTTVNPNDIGQATGVFGKIPSYNVADVSASYKWRMFKLEAGINNFTNNYYFTRRATGYPGPGIIPSDPRTFYTTLQFSF
ncbi:TonB-dependent receptor [Flavobacterium sp. Sd200]|uniref:TonB-dependent receptor n=1 Tax=Flavobacterium sp. Sd200 TaxID=2692211 RepID=UPI00136B4794|nr:TonB-dependent receptor [Flavobacterium sp. Sd200]MXN91098.1 TonB-dependent receptor [Flavobacterium sp. Sd200]